MGEDMKQPLSLDSKLLLPIKKELEATINRLMKAVVTLDKETEISLKITLDKERNTRFVNENMKVWEAPIIKYKISERIKEYKSSFENTIGQDFEINSFEDGFLVEEVNKQENLFEEEA